MTDLLDRSLQRQILSTLSLMYPGGTRDLAQLLAMDADSERRLVANASYLAEHGLLVSGFRRISTFAGVTFQHAGETSITAAGLDFLQDDGGLSAILGVVTVRIDAGQWAELLASRIEQSENLTHEERSSLAAAVRNLPAKAIEKLSSKMLDWAVDHWQDALPLLHKWLAQSAG